MSSMPDTAAKEEKKPNKIGTTIVNVILILAIIFAIIVSFTAFVTKSGSGVPSFMGIRPFAIQTDSMVPEFSHGDLIIDKVVDPAELKEGDVITFWTVIEGQRVLNSHRIIGIDDYGTYRSFTTKGDNNTIEDALNVHQSEVVGRYMFSIPKLGSFIDFLQTSKGFLIVIVIPVAIFFVYHLIQFFKTLFAYKAEMMRLEFEAEAAKRAEQAAAPQPAPASETAKEPGKEE